MDITKLKPENEIPERRREVQSPKGKYRLVIQAYKTGPNSWNYTKGTIYVGEAELVAFGANYSSFTYSFIEDHPNGHDYFICHEDYQGQTVCELDTGKVKRHLPPEAKKGYGFCWTDHQFDAKSQILIVQGCIWACPYETRFYDFGNPMEGWPQIEPKKWVDADNQVKILDDGRIEVREVTKVWAGQPGKGLAIGSDEMEALQAEGLITDEAFDEDSNWEFATDAITWYVREGTKLVEAQTWMTQEETDRRAQQAAREKAEAESWANFKATDEVYLKMVELLAKHKDALAVDGIMYRSWYQGESSFVKSVYRDHPEDSRFVVYVEAGTTKAPVKVKTWKYGVGEKVVETYPRTPEGMEQAIQKALQLRPLLDKVLGWVKG